MLQSVLQNQHEPLPDSRDRPPAQTGDGDRAREPSRRTAAVGPVVHEGPRDRRARRQGGRRSRSRSPTVDAPVTVLPRQLHGDGAPQLPQQQPDGRHREGFAAGDLVELGGVGAATQGGFGDDLLEGFGRVERIGGAKAVALEGDRAEGVLAAFLDLEDDVDPAGGAFDVLDFADLLRIGVFDLDVEVALGAVEFAELTAVVAILFRIEAARAEHPGPLVPAVLAGRKTGFAPELEPIEGLGAFEAIGVDLQFDALEDVVVDD